MKEMTPEEFERERQKKNLERYEKAMPFIEVQAEKFNENLIRMPKQYIYYLTIKDCKRLQHMGQLYHGDYWDLWRDPEARSLGSLNKFASYVKKMNSRK